MDMHAPSLFSSDSQHLKHITAVLHLAYFVILGHLKKGVYKILVCEGQVEVHEEEGLLHQSWEREINWGRGKINK